MVRVDGIKRTKPPVTVNNKRPSRRELEQQVQTLSVLTERMGWASRLGIQYSGDRDIYKALGYKEVLTFQDFATMYERNDMAKAIINRPAEATWRGEVLLFEGEDDRETALEKEWTALATKFRLKSKFTRLDKLSNLGEYGVFLLGFSDAKSQEDLAKPVTRGSGLRLLYVKPLSKGRAEVQQTVQSSSDERFGLPEMYQISYGDHKLAGKTFLVHHSRVIHVPGELLESEYEGEPRLKAVYNRLVDLEKLVGSSAEMFWRGARPGYGATLRENYQATDLTQETLQAQIDEYEHNLRRFLLLDGVDLSSLAMQIADPRGHVDIQVQMISAETGIPKRILTGSERGELASTEDKSSWLELIQGRREEYAEEQIVKPFVDRLIEFGVLPPPGPGGYSVKWSDLYSQSDKDKAEVGKVRASSLREYATQPSAMDILPPEAFYVYCLGLEPEDVEYIQELRDQMIADEEKAMEGAEEEERALQEEGEEEQSIAIGQ